MENHVLIPTEDLLKQRTLDSTVRLIEDNMKIKKELLLGFNCPDIYFKAKIQMINRI